jgi:hypothetical protein
MSRRLLSFFIVVTLGMTPQGWGTEPDVTPIIRFGNPADATRISVASARISEVTGARVNAGGISVRVDFELANWPQLVIRPTEDPADWSGVSALAIPVDNPTTEPIDLVIRVDDDPHADGEHHSLSGRALVRPGEAGVLILPLPTNDALPMGMVAGPPREAPRLDTFVRVIGGARGAIERRHVTAIRLILLKRSAGRSRSSAIPASSAGPIPVRRSIGRSSTASGNTLAQAGMGK